MLYLFTLLLLNVSCKIKYKDASRYCVPSYRGFAENLWDLSNVSLHELNSIPIQILQKLNSSEIHHILTLQSNGSMLINNLQNAQILAISSQIQDYSYHHGLPLHPKNYKFTIFPFLDPTKIISQYPLNRNETDQLLGQFLETSDDCETAVYYSRLSKCEISPQMRRFLLSHPCSRQTLISYWPTYTPPTPSLWQTIKYYVQLAIEHFLMWWRGPGQWIIVRPSTSLMTLCRYLQTMGPRGLIVPAKLRNMMALKNKKVYMISKMMNGPLMAYRQ